MIREQALEAALKECFTAAYEGKAAHAYAKGTPESFIRRLRAINETVNAALALPPSAPQSVNADMLAALRAMWKFAGAMAEKHGMDGDDTMTDAEHEQWQDAGE